MICQFFYIIIDYQRFFKAFHGLRSPELLKIDVSRLTHFTLLDKSTKSPGEDSNLHTRANL